jgi:hypothetical protein
MDGSYWTAQLRPLFEGRRVILTNQVIAHATLTVRLVRSLGASEVFVLATGGTGMGEVVGPDEAVSLSLDVRSDDMLGAIRASNAALRDLPEVALAALRRFDPERNALVIGDFLTESPALDGRPFLAYRRAAWLALDDKTRIDGFWDRAGVVRCPSEVVDVTSSASLLSAVRRLDRGHGTVWAADASHGWNGGAEGVRWVHDDDVDESRTILGRVARFVRIMPFLEGVPCSIHGVVFPDHVIALRPAEMVVFRRSDGSFFYAGCATFWDPPDADREEMRAIARRVGEQLRTEVDYRGAFTVDGVMSVEGFRPTELNPRNGAALNMMVRDLAGELPFQILLDALVAGVPGDWRAVELEQMLLGHVDEHRAGGTWRTLPGALDPRDDHPLTISTGPDGAISVSEQQDGELADAHVSTGPSAIGGFVRAVFVSERTPKGPSVARRAQAFWAWADHELELGVGPLEASTAVR